MKYIIIEGAFEVHIPILFPAAVFHSEISTAFPDNKVIGAGLVNIHDDKSVSVHGKSVSLNLEAKAEDAICIEAMLKNG